jgi:hypothetical protein
LKLYRFLEMKAFNSIEYFGDPFGSSGQNR